MSRYLKHSTAVHLASLFYLGGAREDMDGAQGVMTLPQGTEIVHVEARGGAVYYSINGNAADATAHGYIAADDDRMIGPIANLSSFSLWGAVGAYAHVKYYRRQ